jgi:hypothetical protein
LPLLSVAVGIKVGAELAGLMTTIHEQPSDRPTDRVEARANRTEGAD